SGARQRRQRAHCPARPFSPGHPDGIHKKFPPTIHDREGFAIFVLGSRSTQADPSTNLADGAVSFRRHRTQSQPPHAAPQLCHAHGRKRSRPSYRTNHPRPRRYFHDAGLHARGFGSFEECLPKPSPPRQTENWEPRTENWIMPAESKDNKATPSSVVEKS